MRAPVPYTVVSDWVNQTKDVSPTVADGMVDRHLASVCSRETFGLWAHTFSKLSPDEVEPFIATAIRVGYLEATWTQAVVGIFAALGFEKLPPVPSGVWSAGVMSQPVMTAIAVAVLKARPGGQLKQHWRRALTMLTRTDLASVIDARREQLPRGSRLLADSSSAPVPKTDPPVVKQTQPKMKKKPVSTPVAPTLQPVAAVVVRSRERTDMEAYLAAAGKRDLTVETVFLATALTYRPLWRLLFEQPVSVKIGSRRLALSSVTATMRRDSIALRFIAESGRVVPTHVNVDFRQRTYVTGEASHVAIVLLDLLFAHEGKLSASQAVGDERFAAGRLAADGQEPAAVYRLSDRPRWVDGGASGQLVASGSSNVRRPHDVRGYRQTRGGTIYRVRPHRRSS
ncbi:hypothetical protein [Brevibacterium linens]|uniref:hypothetical protein n=1 Tax=Brevibacterium linens TaxID=1703 RepID=UPI00351499FA